MVAATATHHATHAAAASGKAAAAAAHHATHAAATARVTTTAAHHATHATAASREAAAAAHAVPLAAPQPAIMHMMEATKLCKHLVRLRTPFELAKVAVQCSMCWCLQAPTCMPWRLMCKPAVQGVAHLSGRASVALHAGLPGMQALLALLHTLLSRSLYRGDDLWVAFSTALTSGFKGLTTRPRKRDWEASQGNT